MLLGALKGGGEGGVGGGDGGGSGGGTIFDIVRSGYRSILVR